MLRKALWSISLALIGLSLLVISVMAQDNGAQEDEDAPVVLVQPNVAAATVEQIVPVTLTLTIPSPTGPVTVEVPIFLSLNIRIGISPGLTTTVDVTPSTVTIVGGRSTPTPTATEESDSGESDTSTPVSTIAAATATPTVTPTVPEPIETPVPDEAEPTEVPLPTATPTATVTTQAEVLAPLCPDPRAVITSPGENQVVSAQVNILGTATHENFQYYKVEYAEGANINPDNTFSYLADARVQVTGGLLASFDSTTFANGPYTLKLTVVDNSGNFPPPCTVSVVVEN